MTAADGLAVLHHGKRSERARALAAAANRRAEQRGLAAMKVPETPAITLDLIELCATLAWLLGAQKATADRMRKEREIPVQVQRMIRNPGRRTDEQKRLGSLRVEYMLKERKKRQAEKAKESREHGSSNRALAVNAFLAKVGTVEHPPGSNGGGIITVMQAYWGFGRVPWCGCALGYHMKKFGGVEGLRSDVASVAAIENHGRAGHQPYVRFTTNIDALLPGSALILGGFGVHTGMLVDALGAGRARTVEGNTSFGPGGSQSNGGCIAARVRSDADVRGGCPMNYPLAA